MAKQNSLTDLRRSAGQLLVVGFEGTELSERLRALLSRIQPGGVILFARNIVTAQQTHALMKSCQELSPTPLFRCVDMEGGLVDRLKKAIAPVPSAASVFATGDRKLYRKHGRIIGEECRAAGFNVDFAPVSDLGFEASRPVLASRAVSSDPKQVVVYVREFLGGLSAAGMLGCGKHFPGLGEGKLDSHHELPLIEKAWKRLWAEDLLPYRMLKAKYGFVMVSHAAFPKVTAGEATPASISKKWITGILRQKIGYRGLVASDDLEMGGVLSAVPIDEAAVRHIRAGGDLALICHKEEFIVRAYETLVHRAEGDAQFAQRVKESAARILAFKKKHRSLRRLGPPPTSAAIQRLTRQLWEFSEEVRLEALDREETA